MSCASNGVYFRQGEEITVTAVDDQIHTLDLDESYIPYGWWKTGRRLVFEVPCAGLFYNTGTLEIALRDNTAMTETGLGQMEFLAGTEKQSFTVIADVESVENAVVNLRIYLNYPTFTGIPFQAFGNVAVNTSFRPSAPIVKYGWSAAGSSELTFQNAQFSAFSAQNPNFC